MGDVVCVVIVCVTVDISDIIGIIAVIGGIVCVIVGIGDVICAVVDICVVACIAVDVGDVICVADISEVAFIDADAIHLLFILILLRIIVFTKSMVGMAKERNTVINMTLFDGNVKGRRSTHSIIQYM